MQIPMNFRASTYLPGGILFQQLNPGLRFNPAVFWVDHVISDNTGIEFESEIRRRLPNVVPKSREFTQLNSTAHDSTYT